MKICLISYAVYEYDNRVHRYGASLHARGDEVDVICLGMADDEEPIVDFHGVTLHKIQKREIDEKGPVSYLVKICRFFLKAFMKLTRLHWAKRYDVIHYNNIPDFGIFCTIIPRLMGARIIMDIHDLVPEFYMRKFNREEDDFIIRLLRWIEKVSCQYAHHVVTVTEMWKDVLIHRSVPEEKCTVILNAPYPPLFDSNIAKHEKEKKNSKPFTLLYHGALNEHFGVDIAIRAMSIVRQKVDNVRFVIVGNGREKDNLEKLTNDLNLNGHVVFKDPVPRTEIPGLIRDADVGVVPKRSDKFADTALSSKLLEFAYMRKPVVVSRTTASKTYFDENMVLFFEPENSAELAEKIIRVYNDAKLRKTLSGNIDVFNQNHNWKKYEKLYFQFLNSK